MQFHTRQCQFLILVLLFSVGVQTRRVIRAAPGIQTTGQYMVVLTPDTSHERFEAVAKKVQTQSLSSEIHKVEGPFAKIFVTKLSVEEAYKVKDLDNVEFVEEETFAEASISWALDRIDQVSPVLDSIFEPGRDGEGVDIYILDTGINYDHCEFDGNRAVYTGYDPCDNYYRTNQKGQDCNGHGTHVASLACGKYYGVAKKANCYSVRVLGCSGSAPWSVVIDGLNSAATNITNKIPRRPAIISMSLRGSNTSSVNNVSNNIVNMGIPIVAAAGNDRDNACNYSPASAPEVITVASSARGDNVSFFTNGGSCVDIFAPGSDVTAADYGCDGCTCTRTQSGTSMATPLVSGAIALYLQEEPLLTPSQIMEKLTEDCLMSVLNFDGLSFSLQDTTPNCLLHVNNISIELASGSGMESQYLKFIHLGLQANIFKNVDDHTTTVQLPSTFQMGESTFDSLYISSNGLLSFGTPFPSFSPTSFPLSSAVVIAPFWDDILLTNTGIVEYGIITTANTSSVINEVEKFLQLSQNIDLELDWVLIAKWINVCPYQNSDCAQTNTFQVVIASQGAASYAIFTYKCDLLQWTKNNAAIGYSAGNDNFVNHPLSKTIKVTDIDCLNYPSSVWSNVVYNLNEEANGRTPQLPTSNLLFPASTSIVVTPFLIDTQSTLATPTPTITLEANSRTPQPSMSNLLISASTSLVVTPFLIDTLSTLATPTPTITLGSGTESKYLTFLNLGLQTNIFRNVDDSTREVRLPSSFNIGGITYHTLYISSNGLLSFGTPFTSTLPRSFPLSSTVVIAPFWDDIILTYTGIVEYGIVTSSSTSSVINEVEGFLKLKQSIDLDLDWVFVAKWSNVCPFGNSYCAQTNTFQVVVASQGSTSYAIFTYKCDLLQWTRNNAAIGYSAGLNNFANHPFSKTSRVTDVDCVNYPLSVWSNVVYKLNEERNSGSPQPLTSSPGFPDSTSFVFSIDTVTPIPTNTLDTATENLLLLSSSMPLPASFSSALTQSSSNTIVTPIPTGSCLALNLNYSGCCVWSLSQTCWNNGCFCDQSCHYWNDCCSDIYDIGCHPSFPYSPLVSPTPTDTLGT